MLVNGRHYQKSLETGARSMWGLTVRQETALFKEFFKHFKSGILSMFTVKFYAQTVPASKCILMLVEPEEQVRNKILAGQKRANDKDTYGLCIKKIALKFKLLAGSCHDAPEGVRFIESLGGETKCHLVTDRTYKDDKTRAIVIKQGLSLLYLPKNALKI